MHNPSLGRRGLHQKRGKIQLYKVKTENRKDLSLSFSLSLLRFYLFIHERHRVREKEAETQAEGEAGSTQGARCGTRSRDSGSRPGPKADAQPLSHPGVPNPPTLKGVCLL